MDAKELILADAIETAIRSERTVIKQKRIIASLICIIIGLIIGYFI